MTIPRSILGVFAHPDDESMGPGGTLAKYAAEGHRVAFITATDGGAGRLYDERPADNSELRRMRREETRNAAKIMGVEFLGFLDRDDGMLVEDSILEIEHEIVSVIRTWRPDVLVTFHGSGISHHPDHRVIWLALCGAFHGAAWPEWYRDERVRDLPPCRPKRLYTYTARLEAVKTIDWPREIYASPDDEITTLIDTREFANTRWAAIQAHTTQSGGPPFANMYEGGLFSEEAFVRVLPTFEGGERETDLLAGLD
jgi:LmbE family N-acetylglucosaminyl deacetylase